MPLWTQRFLVFWYFIVYLLRTPSTYHSVRTILLNNKCRYERVKRNEEFQESKEMLWKRSTVTISSKWHYFMALCIHIHRHNYVGNSQNEGKLLRLGRDKNSILEVSCICCWLLLRLMVRLLAIDPDEYCNFPPIYWVDLSFSFWFVEKKIGTCSGGLGTYTIQQGVGHPQPTDESCYQCMEWSTDESRFTSRSVHIYQEKKCVWGRRLGQKSCLVWQGRLLI